MRISDWSSDVCSSDLADAVARHGADRVAVFLGTSTAGTLATEHAYRQRDVDGRLPAPHVYRRPHTPNAVAEVVRLQLGPDNLASSLCSACSSSATGFAAAQRDRTTVVQGERVRVPGEPGGGRH